MKAVGCRQRIRFSLLRSVERATIRLNKIRRQRHGYARKNVLDTATSPSSFSQCSWFCTQESMLQQSSPPQIIKPDPNLVDARYAPNDYDDACAVVYKDFISSSEADLLTNELVTKMKRRRYEKGHWDAAITQYKEIELLDDSFEQNDDDDDTTSSIPQTLDRIRQHLQFQHLNYKSDHLMWLSCHAIDLQKEGQLTAHVDSTRFSGDLVAGLSLMSSSIMRLKPDPEFYNDEGQYKDISQGHVDLLLPPQSLYVLTGVGRYKYSHELLPDSSVFNNPINGTEITIKRDHRLSIIFRDAKEKEEDKDQ